MGDLWKTMKLVYSNPMMGYDWEKMQYVKKHANYCMQKKYVMDNHRIIYSK